MSTLKKKERKNGGKEEKADLGWSRWHSLADLWESSEKCKTVFKCKKLNGRIHHYSISIAQRIWPFLNSALLHDVIYPYCSYASSSSEIEYLK